MFTTLKRRAGRTTDSW